MTDKNNEGRVYNVVTTGLGFLNRIREFTPPKGGKPYLSCDVALMEGVTPNVNYVRFSAVVKGQEAKEILRQHFTVNGEVKSPQEPVVASVTLGGLEPRTFVFKKGDKAGETGISLQCALLSIKYLKIGDRVIDLKDEQTDAGEQDKAQEAAPSGEPAFARDMRAEYEREGCVSLSKDHPEFIERKDYLREKGFRWDRARQAWVKKPVQEEPEDFPF